MHRVDITRATGAELVLTPEHDGRLVADLVSDWASTHVDPFVLELTGPAGGTFVRGDVVVPTRIDAVEFLRVVSGRGTGDGLLARLGERLEDAVRGVGRAYRLGGDEFCVLARPGAAG